MLDRGPGIIKSWLVRDVEDTAWIRNNDADKGGIKRNVHLIKYQEKGKRPWKKIDEESIKW